MSRLIGWNAFGVILSIIIGFIPSIIAFVKQNIYKGQVVLYQGIVFVINLAICILLNILPRIIVFNIIRNIWDVVFAVIWIYFLVRESNSSHSEGSIAANVAFSMSKTGLICSSENFRPNSVKNK